MKNFDKKEHICKFQFSKYDYSAKNSYRQFIYGNLYLNELTIEIVDKNNKTIDVIGFSLDNELETLLPLLVWGDYEKIRDIAECDMNSCGYRDGWGYEFMCCNDSGNSLIQCHLSLLFDDKNKPIYEMLLDWIIIKYSKDKRLKKYNLIW